MKVLAVVLMVTAIAAAKPLSDEMTEVILALKKQCMESSGVAGEVLEQFKKGVYQEDDTLKQFLFCFFSNAGFINEAGEYQIDVIKGKFIAELGAEEGERIVNACTGQNHGSGIENSFHMAKCFHEKTIEHVSLA